MNRPRDSWSRVSSLPLILSFAAATACGESAPVAPDPIVQEARLKSFETVARFDAFAGELPQSITADRSGSLYVSMPSLGEVWMLEPSGSFPKVVATFPLEGMFGVGGLQFDLRDNLYATNASTNADVRGVWKIGSGGEKERIPGTGGIAIPNDIAIAPDGTLYITDSAGAIWRVLAGGAAEIWLEDETLVGSGAYDLGFPLGANGIVITPGGGTPSQGPGQASNGGLVVANSEKGQVVHVPILPDGSSGQPTVLVAHPSLFGLDAITMDARGTIYGVTNAGNTLVRMSRDGRGVSELFSGMPLDSPTGLTFGSRNEGHTLFVLNSASTHPLNDPPTLDDARPGVIAVHVDAPGVSGR